MLTLRRLRGPSSRSNRSLMERGYFAGFNGSIGRLEATAAMFECYRGCTPAELFRGMCGEMRQ